MRRKRLTMNLLRNNFSDIIKSIETENVYVCRFPDGVCILVNIQKKFERFKFIMYNPMSSMVTRAEMSRKEFKSLFDEALAHLSREHYEIEKEEGIDVIVQFASIADGLMALNKGSFRSYKVRMLS